MSAHSEQAAALIAAVERDLLALQLLNQTGRAPHEVIGFQLRALNGYAMQFRYESCGWVLIAAPDCEQVAERLQAQALAEYSRQGTL